MLVRHAVTLAVVVLLGAAPGCDRPTALAEAHNLPLTTAAARDDQPQVQPSSASPRPTLKGARAALAAGHQEQAAADLVELLADPGLDAAALAEAAQVAALSGDPNARRLVLQRQLEQDRGAALPLQLALGQVLLELDDAAGAIALYESLLPGLRGQDGLLSVPLLEGLAQARSSLGDHEGALALRERAAALLDQRRQQLGQAWDAALTGLSRSYAATGRSAELARLAADLALDDEHGDPAGPRQVLLAATRGLVLSRSARHAEAVALLGPAVASLAPHVAPTHPDLALARRRLAISRAATGDDDRARAELSALLADLRAAGPAGPASWRAAADLASLHLSAGDHAAAVALDEARVAETAAQLPAEHPLRLAALGDLCWSLAASGRHDVLADQRGALGTGSALLLDRLSGQLPARREELLAEVDAQLALLLALDLASDAEPTSTWELLERRHARAAAVSIQAGSAADDPELADRRTLVRASERQLQQLLRDGRGDELAAAADTCARAHQDLDQALRERDLGALTFDRASAAAALPADTVWVSLDVLGPDVLDLHARDQAAPGARREGPEVLAHVLSGDGRLTRHRLGPLADVRAASEAWLAAGAPLAGDAHERLVELLVTPLATRTAAATQWWLRSAADLPALPLEAFTAGTRLADVPHLGAALAPRPSWELPARLVSAVLPDLAGAPAADAGLGTATRSPALPVALSAESRRASDALGALVTEIERRHGPRGGAPVQRISGADVTRATLGRLVAEARDVLLLLPAWTAPSVTDAPAVFTPSRSSARDGQAAAHGVSAGLALAGALRPRDELGRLPGLASVDDLSRWHLLAADLVCLPTLETEQPGLSQAFLRAGARALLTPLWASSSDARTQLLDEFLRRHWEQGLPARQALREAQGSLLADGRPPRDVLGWRLLGQP